MDTVKVRELPVKSSALALTDLLVMEDNDGTKTVEVGQFRSLLQQSIYFNTVEDMKNATLHEGDVVQTLGFREINDGGGAIYKIVYAPTDLDDGMLIHYLHTSDTLRAHLVTSGYLNVLQCGAHGDGISDDYSIINKAMQKGMPLYFPKRTYKLSGPIEIKSDTVIDFNGATLRCDVSSCICLGLTEEMNNITIKNAKFIGKYGIEIYSYSKNIIIENCIFDGMQESSITMDKAISLNGVSDVIIRGCTTGSVQSDNVQSNVVKTSIQIASGTKDKNSVGNSNILITGNKFNSYMYGINMTSTILDKNTIISNNQFKGFMYKYLDPEQPSVGIQISCNSDSIIISSCGFNIYDIGIRVAGVVDVNLGCTDIICDNVQTMYSVLSSSANVVLSGLQKFNGVYDRTAKAVVLVPDGYFFQRMSGVLTLSSDIMFTQLSENPVGFYDYSDSLTGSVIDSRNPATLNQTQYRVNDIISEDTSGRIGIWKNLAINIIDSGDITKIGPTALKGAVIALYSSSGAVLKNNSNTICGEDIVLNKYTPVILKNINGLWTRVA